MPPHRAGRYLAAMLRHALVLLCLSLPQRLVAQGGAMFDRVAAVLSEHFVDRTFRRAELPQLVTDLRPAAHATTTLLQERDVVQELLEQIPASHLALYSRATYARLMDELAGKARPTLGCVLTRHRDRWFVDGVLDGGPAAAAGLRRGDQVLAIDGEPPKHSPRLDWRADDAWLADPPVHSVLVDAGDTVTLRVASHPNRARDVAVTAKRTSSRAASVASLREIEAAGHSFGYLHLWLVFAGATDLFERAADRFRDGDGIVFDLRGRGGHAGEVAPILRVLSQLHDDGMPMVFLVDEGTRSAKEVLAHEVRARGLGLLVGERTAGAVLPASFEAIGDDVVLMFPRARLGRHSQTIEGIGVAPDHRVDDELPFAAGRDAILDAAIAVLVQQLDGQASRVVSASRTAAGASPHPRNPSGHDRRLPPPPSAPRAAAPRAPIAAIRALPRSPLSDRARLRPHC